ncbi:MAG: hypothetical protein ACQEXJ_21285 [Myxococcota bacterium]
MRSVPSFLAVLLLALGAGAPSHAQEEEPPVGELHVKMNTQFAKVSVDGHEWSAVEFENMGKKAVIKNLDLSEEKIEVTLTPVDQGYEGETLTLEPDDFKRRRRGRVVHYVAKRTVRFDKKPQEEPLPKPDEEPEPEREKVVPEPDEDDLL